MVPNATGHDVGDDCSHHLSVWSGTEPRLLALPSSRVTITVSSAYLK